MIDLLWVPATVPLGVMVAMLLMDRLERFASRTKGGNGAQRTGSGGGSDVSGVND